MSIKSHSPLAWERRKCRAKKAFDTVQEAGIKVADFFLNHKILSRIYECPHCEKYHLTTRKEENA